MKCNLERHNPLRRAARPIRLIRTGIRPGAIRRLLSHLSSLLIVLLLSGLILHLTVGTSLARSAILPADSQAGSTNTSSEPAGLLPGEFSFYDSGLYNRSQDLLNRDEPLVSVTADPVESIPLVQPTLTPLIPATPTPSPYPRVFDADGFPQEGMPVSEFLTDDSVFYVRVNHANVRTLPSTNAAPVVQLTMGDKITRLGYGIDWSRIRMASGKTGYVLTSLITSRFVPKPTPTPTPKPTAKPTPKPTPRPTVTPAPVGSTLTDEQKQAIVDMARSFIGTRYVYGAMSPSVGFDCSGLTSYIYKTLFAVGLPRSAKDQAKAGVAVASADIEIGDILCFDWSSPYGVCDHVGIYVGNGRYVHASYSAGKVLEAQVTFGRTPVISIRRIIH